MTAFRPLTAALLLTAAALTASPAHAQPADVLARLSQGPTRFDAAAAPELQVKRTPTGHLLVRPVINTLDAGWFIFDTGAGICVISTPHLDRFNLTQAGSLQTTGVGGTEAAQLYRADTISLGPVTLQDHPVMSTDLSFLKPHLGEDIVGVIGYGVLSRTIAEIDISAPRIALHNPDTYTLTHGQWSPLIMHERLPAVPATFEGQNGTFRLDTGANGYVTFHEPAVRKFKLLENRQGLSDTRLGGVGGVVTAKSGPIADFTLGGVRRENITATFATEPKGTFANAELDGNIGAELLKPFIIITDYTSSRIAFIPR